MAFGNKKVEPSRNLSPASAKIVSAVIGPTPGMVTLRPLSSASQRSFDRLASAQAGGRFSLTISWIMLMKLHWNAPWKTGLTDDSPKRRNEVTLFTKNHRE